MRRHVYVSACFYTVKHTRVSTSSTAGHQIGPAGSERSLHSHIYAVYPNRGKTKKNTKKERKRKLCAHCQLKRARRPGGSVRLAAVRIQSNTHVFDVFGGRAPDWTSGL